MTNPPDRAPRATADIQQALAHALAQIHRGQLRQATEVCNQVLAREARNFNALQLLGHIALQSADYRGAAQWLLAAKSVDPSSPSVNSNLAVALLALSRPREALDCCETALRTNPRMPEALCNRGNALRALERAAEALTCYERAIAANGGFYDALRGSAEALLTLGRFEEALAHCDRMLRLRRHGPEEWVLRGSALLQAKRTDESLAAFDRALELSPEMPEAWNNKGTALRDLRRSGEALAAYERAAALRPTFAEVWCNVANLSLDAGRYEEALSRGQRALDIRPDFIEALNIRGTALRMLNRFKEAAETYQRLLALSPDHGHAHSHLLSARASLCDWSERSELAARVMQRVDGGESASSPHAFLWICGSAAAQQRCASLYAARQFPAAAPIWRGGRYEHARLRVAYLSADFCDHPVAHLIAGVLERHDRGHFETFGISLRREPLPSATGLRMQRAFEHFHDASGDSDGEVAMLLKDREIDIAVDLTGHTRGGRLGILAFRPAPVQINFLGYAGTSGADYVDYIIGDDAVIPEGSERFFSEHVVRMPHSFLPNDASQAIGEGRMGRAAHGLPDCGFVFCAFNNAYKINPLMFDAWMRILIEVPDAVLWLRGSDPDLVANLAREAEARGVAADRLIFASRLHSMAEHLARYRDADLFLDTLPYGAHATARDALWAGLPVLTCAGESFAGRVAASLLKGLAMPELIAVDLRDYVSRALALARTPALLLGLRTRLLRERYERPLFDTGVYRQDLESAYLALNARQRRGEAPTPLDVATLR